MLNFNPQNPVTNSTMIEFLAKIISDAACIAPPLFPRFSF